MCCVHPRENKTLLCSNAVKFTYRVQNIKNPIKLGQYKRPSTCSYRFSGLYRTLLHKEDQQNNFLFEALICRVCQTILNKTTVEIAKLNR